jgi:hypothetical protein
MSSADPKAAAYERAVQYLEQTLRLNPLNDGAMIIRRRSRLLGLEAAPKAAAAAGGSPPNAAAAAGAGSARTGPVLDTAAARQKQLARIEDIRGRFWTTPLPMLKASLEKMSGDDFPDIQSVVKRLSVVAAHRDQIPRLTTDKAFDGDFFKVFKEVLVAAPRDCAIVKERTLAAFGDAKLRKRGTKMIGLIERELPYLYELESQWMKSLVSQRNRKLKPASDEQYMVAPVSEGFSIPWWSIFIVIAILKAVLRFAND